MSEPILALPSDIDDQILDFCDRSVGIQPLDVIRDLARIACIMNLVRQGELTSDKLILAGGMAMRCLNSNRMSIYDVDASALIDPQVETLEAAIDYRDQDILIRAHQGPPGKKMINFKPVEYEAFFSDLEGRADNFSLGISSRGVELAPKMAQFNHRYPFQVLHDENVQVPILNPVEMLAEKLCAWLLFGHAKHYNDIAFLTLFLKNEFQVDQKVIELKNVIRAKLITNKSVGETIRIRVELLTERACLERLERPEDHLDQLHGFETLSYFTGERPDQESVREIIKRHLVPVLRSNRGSYLPG